MEHKYPLINNENPYNPEDFEGSEYVTIEIPLVAKEWLPDDVVTSVVNAGTDGEVRWTQVQIEKSTYEAFLKLQQLAREKFGLEIEISEAQRAMERQAKYFQNAVEEKGQEYADSYVAKPGYSEHHTGRAFDYALRMPRMRTIKNPVLKNIIYKVKKPIAFMMVNREAARLGLIVRYPMFGKKFTGYNYERWHLSNVGDPVLASYLFSHNMTLEQFYANASKYASSYERFAEEYAKKHPEVIAQPQENDIPQDDDEMGE